MDAGVLAYKLCDRGFDCSHCPLDAALRGLSGTPTQPDDERSEPGAPPLAFPDDRSYWPGHCWSTPPARPSDHRRLGLDAFAAHLIGRPLGVRSEPDLVASNDRRIACVIDLPEGELPIALPGPGRVGNWNHALVDEPGRIARSPYTDGWLVEWVPRDAEAHADQQGASAAWHRARLDTRHFYRRVAYELLASSDKPLTPSSPSMSFREALGAPTYLSLLKELIY